MNSDPCKLAEFSARCVRRGNDCLYVQKEEKLAEIEMEIEYECLNSE